MAKIKDLTMTVGNIESLPDGRIRIQGSPIPPNNDYRKVTLNFVMEFGASEIGLKYRLYATLFANDRQIDDVDDGVSISLGAGENVGLTKIIDLTELGRPLNFFNNTYFDVDVNNVSMPLSIGKYVLNEKLNEDSNIDIINPGSPPFRLRHHKDELLARVTLATVAETTSRPTAL